MRIAIDTGGTFTDCVYESSGKIEILKLRSTPADPGEALLKAVAAVAANEPGEVRHGTTVGTNALLERRGARVAFVTTEGFEDAIAIGRQARPKLYDLEWKQEEPLATEDLRFGVRERIASDGSVLEPLSERELKRITEAVAAARPESIAISLLFSFANPAHERALAEAFQELRLPVSLSHRILPEFREYERGSTVLINAYLAPKMQSYLERLDGALRSQDGQLHVMQSSGGIISAATAANEPVRTILSGPAGGVIGAVKVASEAGFDRILTFDMGGTSTDVALVNGSAPPITTKDSVVMGMPVAIPMLDIQTVGAGGGSLASFDAGGALKVGPRSAGADPGPICFGKGEFPTVTDANLLLGRIDPESFLGGAMRLDEARTRERFQASKGPLASVEQFAEGILRVADSVMEKALRRISLEQGYDTRDFVLVSFGGAGPLHACSLARSLRIAKVLVPNFPGALSAYGILIADAVRDYSRTVMLPPQPEALEVHFQALERLARNEAEFAAGEAIMVRSVDVRYVGQGFELAVAWSADFVEDFHRLHQQRYGYSDRRRSLEVVNVRVRVIGSAQSISPGRPEEAGSRNAEEAIVKRRPMFHEGSWSEGLVYDRQRLAPGMTVTGPAVVIEYSATTFLPPYATASVDRQRNLIIEVVE